jgi:hypothetical protein
MIAWADDTEDDPLYPIKIRCSVCLNYFTPTIPTIHLAKLSNNIKEKAEWEDGICKECREKISRGAK